MIKVTVGNNVKREAVIIDENTTLRSCLEANGVDYTRGVMHLDGSSLNPGDLDKTFQRSPKPSDGGSNPFTPASCWVAPN